MVSMTGTMPTPLAPPNPTRQRVLKHAHHLAGALPHQAPPNPTRQRVLKQQRLKADGKNAPRSTKPDPTEGTETLNSLFKTAGHALLHQTRPDRGY